VTAATLLGILQLIPELGFFLGFLPILLVLGIAGPGPAIAAAIVDVVADNVADTVVGTSVRRGVLDVHPGLLIPGIVVLSQFGIAWLLLAAPVIAIGRDLVRYTAGRLAEPAAPAGVLLVSAAASRGGHGTRPVGLSQRHR
jgi:predicted PurR-regulated permease PerM